MREVVSPASLAHAKDCMMSEGSEEGAVEDNNRDEVASLDESGAEDGEDIQNSEGEHNQVCTF